MSAIKIETDLTGLNQAMSELAAVTKKDFGELTRIEAGQMAWRIAQKIGPTSASDGNNKIEKDIKSRLTIKPVKENIKGEHQGSGDVKWLYAGSSFVAGIPSQNDQKKASAAEAMKIYYAEKKKAPQNAWSSVGKRGNQNVVISNRIRISKSAFNQVFKAIKANVGQAKASFAFTASKTTAKRIPSWISRHLGSEANGKALFTDRTQNSLQPFIEFGSRAKGVESNRRMVAAINGGVASTVAILKNKVEKLFNGYAYDFKTGAVFRPKSETFDRN